MNREDIRDNSIMINGIKKDSINQEDTVENDVVYDAYTPWRRYFARGFDLAIYGMIWKVLLVQLFNINVILWDRSAILVVDILVNILLILLLEPLMLSKLGTTPGKKILALEVRSKEGKKLSYWEAFDRSFGVLKYGMGFIIPIYGLVRNYKSYVTLDEKRKLPWDKKIQYRLLDKKWYRGIGIVIGYILIFMIIVISGLFAAFPPNTGDITVSEYAENYNYLVNHYDQAGSYYLDPEGAWVKKAPKSNDGSIRVTFDKSILPSLDYITEGKYLKSVVFELEVDADDDMIISPLKRVTFGTMAFVLADDLIKPWSFDAKDKLGVVNKELFEVYKIKVGETIISNTVESEGFSGSTDGHYLHREKNAEDGYYYMKVKVER